MITNEPSQGSAASRSVALLTEQPPASRSGALLTSPSLAQLPERHTSEYRFRNTVAFWIAISFVEGSLLFLCGAVVSMCALGDEWMRRGLVEYAYFAGSLFFSLGAYLGFFQVINVGNATTRLVGCRGTSVEAYWGSLLYFLGALCFNVACAVGLLPHTDALSWAAYWAPSTLGSLCFVLAAIIEFKHNSHVRCSTPVFWLCFWYLAGSLLFLVAAAAGWPHQVEDVEDGLVNPGYALGSIAFALGAWCALWMWKAEQFGLGFIREINEVWASATDKSARGAGFYESPYDEPVADNPGYMERPWRSTRSAPERRSAASLISVEGGAAAEDSTNTRRMPSADDSKPAKVDLKQQAFLLVYVLLGTLSVLNLCTTIACEQEAARGHAELGAARLAAAGTILASLSVFFAAHVILMLATVVHRTPSLHPYDYLLWCMRFGALLFFAAEATRFASVLGRFEGG